MWETGKPTAADTHGTMSTQKTLFQETPRTSMRTQTHTIHIRFQHLYLTKASLAEALNQQSVYVHKSGCRFDPATNDFPGDTTIQGNHHQVHNTHTHKLFR